jgi:competence protein ComEC
VAGVFRGRWVGAVLTPSSTDPESGRDLVRAAAAGGRAASLTTVAGARHPVGAVDLLVLGPPYPLAGTRSDPNNNSLVLRATVAGVRILLAGDAEAEEQHAMVARATPGQLRADVLKVAHHGSAYQDLGFLDAVRPTVALVPVGAGNTYGHPSPGLLSRLGRGGARVLRTDTDGDLAAVRTRNGLAVAHRGVPPGRQS